MRPASTVKEVLIAAKWILKNVGWCQGAYGKKDGIHSDYGSWGDRSCNSFCSSGVIRVIDATPELQEEAWKRLTCLATKQGYTLVEFNDASSKEQVLKLFGQAIEEST